jgi:hypothetical protein
MIAAIRFPVPSFLTNNSIQISLAVFLFVGSSWGQQAPQSAEQNPQEQNRSGSNALTLPAGTRLPLILTHPVDSKTTHRGDQIFAQTSTPVVAGSDVAIPAGAFVQGRVEKLSRRGSRAEMVMQSASIIFPDGYVARISGPIQIESEEGTAWNNPSTAAKTGALIAPFAGSGIGLAIGSAFHDTSNLGGMTITSASPKALGIGSLVGLGAGGAISLILLARSHHFYLEAGSPMQLSLPRPVTLASRLSGSPGSEPGADAEAVLPLGDDGVPSHTVYDCFSDGNFSFRVCEMLREPCTSSGLLSPDSPSRSPVARN